MPVPVEKPVPDDDAPLPEMLYVGRCPLGEMGVPVPEDGDPVPDDDAPLPEML